ncbi:MAG: hypothetical protein WCJ64_24245 [Rhodospirillaceae bacterium]
MAVLAGEGEMIIGGNYEHHFQLGPLSPAQRMQNTLESGSNGNDSFTAQAAANGAKNQQSQVNTLRASVSRGQGIDMFV